MNRNINFIPLTDEFFCFLLSVIVLTEIRKSLYEALEDNEVKK